MFIRSENQAGKKWLGAWMGVWALALIVLGGAPLGAQVEVTATVVLEPEDFELRERTLERFDVKLLSRGVLLEALDDESAVGTIEISGQELAADGEVVSIEDLRERLGEADSNLVLQLSELDETRLRELFSAEPEEATVIAEVVVETEEDLAEAEEKVRSLEKKLRKKDTQVVFGTSLTVEEDEVAREAVVFGAPLTVRGVVKGDAAAIGSSATISGEVTGDVVSVGGNVRLESGAEVAGDVVSVGGTIDEEDDVEIGGQRVEVPFGKGFPFWRPGGGAIFNPGRWYRDDDWHDFGPMDVAMSAAWEGFALIMFVLFACLVLLLGRKPLERMERKVATEPWKSGLVGLLSQILILPLFIVVLLVLVISIIGIPLLLLLPFAILGLMLLAFMGFCAVALRLGRILEERFGWNLASPYLVLIVGIAAIAIWSVIADLLDYGGGWLWFFVMMFAIFGALVKYVAWTVGFGAAVLTRFGTAEGWGGQAAPPAPVAPTPPPVEPDPPTEPEYPYTEPEAGGVIDIELDEPGPSTDDREPSG
jgi:hypothetical protein